MDKVTGITKISLAESCLQRLERSVKRGYNVNDFQDVRFAAFYIAEAYIEKEINKDEYENKYKVRLRSITNSFVTERDII